MLNGYSRSPGGASLTASFSFLMTHSTFKNDVMRRMTYEEKLRLYALHEQAVHGDAPLQENGTTTASDGHSSSSPPAGFTSWLNFAGRARQKRWEALRGRMTPQVAREAFCAEFLALLEKYPVTGMVPLVEAALSRARAVQSEKTTSTERKTADCKELLVFCIRAFQQDPAALAMLWICKAYGIPCELTVEPLTKAVSLPAVASLQRKRKGITGESDLFYTATSIVEGKVFIPFYTGVRQGPNFVTEVAGVEAGFQLLCSLFLSHMPHWAGVTPTSTRCDPGATERRQRDAGVSDNNRERSGAEAEEGLTAASQYLRARHASEQAEWLEDLTGTTVHVRTPIMALLIEEATGIWREAAQLVGEEEEQQEKAAMKAAGVASAAAATPLTAVIGERRRRPQLRALAAHLNSFQRNFALRRAQRGASDRLASSAAARCASLATAGTPLSLPKSVFDADAAVKVVDVFYRKNATHRLVSCVDLYVACCGYVLCTSPFSQRLFPQLNSVNCEEAAWLLTRSSAFDTELHINEHGSNHSDGKGRPNASTGPASRSAPSPSRGLPAVRLPGMPAGYNDIINSVLRRETRAALRYLDDPAALSDGVNTNSSGSLASHRTLSFSESNNGAACGLANASTAADAMERFMLSQMLSLNVDDICVKSAGGETAKRPADLVNSALTPFLTLAHIFTGAWALSQRQCVGFPFLLMAAPPSRQVNFLWEEKGVERAGEAVNPCNSLGGKQRPFIAIPENRLGERESYGVDSWESRLREVGWNVLNRILFSGKASKNDKDSTVYRTDGTVKAKL